MRQRRLLVQVAVAAVLLGLVALLVNNLAVNLIRTGLGLGFGWLGPVSYTHLTLPTTVFV